MTNQQTTILVVFAIFLAFRPVIGFLVMLIAYLRAPITATRADRDTPMAEWNVDQAAVLDELFALGFDQNAEQIVYEIGGERFATWHFSHRFESVVAALSDRISPLTLYTFYFYSFTPAGDTVFTTNRSGAYFGEPQQPGMLHLDSMSSTLTEQWNTHLARSKKLQCEPIEINLALDRIANQSEAHFDWLRQCAAIHFVDGAWHFSFATAVRLTLAWRQISKQAARAPYRQVKPIAEEATLRQRLAMFELYSHSAGRQGRRRDIKLMMFALTLVLALMAWGWLFTWPTAVALVVIIFFHESGHAAAMWMFGQRDISLFFIPFVGAVVTAKPGQLAAWQQMVILLAGPLPGLAIGVGMLLYANADAYLEMPGWANYALLAIFVNLFNLLPIGFLDGGQLVELATFARRPRARFVFQLCSVFALVAVARYSNGVAAWVIAGAVAFSLWPQFRLMRLSAAWRDGLSDKEQVANLMQASMQGGVVSFARQYATIRSVMARQAMRRSRSWESVLIVSIMVVIWTMALGICYGGWFADSFGLS